MSHGLWLHGNFLELICGDQSVLLRPWDICSISHTYSNNPLIDFTRCSSCCACYKATVLCKYDSTSIAVSIHCFIPEYHQLINSVSQLDPSPVFMIFEISTRFLVHEILLISLPQMKMLFCDPKPEYPKLLLINLISVVSIKLLICISELLDFPWKTVLQVASKSQRSEFYLKAKFYYNVPCITWEFWHVISSLEIEVSIDS